MKKNMLSIDVYVKLFFVAFFWGTSAIAGKIALQYCPPSMVIFFGF